MSVTISRINPVYALLRAWFERMPRVAPCSPTIKTLPEEQRAVVEPGTLQTPPTSLTARTVIQIQRSRRSDIDALSVAIAKRENRTQPLSRAETLQRFGERGYRIAVVDQRIVAFAAWEADNLVALVRDLWAESPDASSLALPKLIGLIEEEARRLVCEIVLLFIDVNAPSIVIDQVRAAGYQPQGLDTLHKNWKSVAQERLSPGDLLWSKRLREEMVTEPI